MQPHVHQHTTDMPLPPISIPEREKPAPLTDLKSPFGRHLPGFAETTEFRRGSSSGGSKHQLVAWSFLAAFIDSVFLFGVASSFLFIFSLLVKVQMISAVGVLSSDLYKAGLVMATCLVWFYMIMLRVFLGFTLGEWVCGLRLGNLKQRLNRFYSLKVVARMTLIFATGLFLLPLISLLMGMDLSGKMVRLPLTNFQK